MPSADFDRTLEVGSSPQRCWEVLTDVQKVAGWVTVAGDVTEHEHLSTYDVVLADQFGPFKLKADVAVEVTDLTDGESIRFRAQGADRHVGTSINAEAHMALTPTGSGTAIRVAGRYSVLGSVAAMGTSTIKKKADTILEEFFSAAAAELA